jgi:Uma2 family endonuclease
MGEPVSVSALDFQGPWTVEDLALVVDDGHKYEIIDGALLVNPPPTNFHQAIGRRLFTLLLQQAPPEWEAVYELAFLTDGGVLEPDAGLIRAGIPTPRGVVGYHAADVGLVVEVVSPSSRTMDRVLKPAQYAAAGVPWYWRVENDAEVEVLAFELVAGEYVERCRLLGAGVLPGPFPVEVDTAVLAGSSA